MKKVCIVVPCYNEAQVLPLFYEEIIKYMPNTYQFSLIFIDDGSTDNTLSIIKGFATQNKNVYYISLSRNFGKESAMLAGLDFAKKTNQDAAIIIDADLQHPPHIIIDMLQFFEQGAKHVVARQQNRKGGSKIKALCAKVFYRMFSVLTGFKHVNHGAVDYSLIDKDVIEAILLMKDHVRFTKGIFAWVGFEKKTIDFDYTPRDIGATKWSFYGLWKYAISGIKQFSNLYLLIASILVLIVCAILATNLIIGIINQNIQWQLLRQDLLALVIIIGIRVIIQLLYDIRDQGLDRPHYIVKENNTHEENND